MIRLSRSAAALTALTMCLAAGCQQTSEPSPPPIPGDVGILVLDAFSKRTRPKTATPGTPPQKPADNCPYEGIPSNEVGSGGGGLGLPEGVTHGAAVFDTVRSELDLPGRGLTRLTSAPSVDHSSVGDRVIGWGRDGLKIVLVGVDTASFDLATITSNITAVMAEMNNDLGITRFVLNMSFIILPCNLLDWYGDPADPNPDVKTMLDDLANSMSGIATLDTLKSTINGLSAGKTTLPVKDLIASDAGGIVTEIVLVNLVLGRLVREWHQEKGFGASTLYESIYMKDKWRLLLEETKELGYEVIPVGAAGNGVFLPGTKGRTTVRFPFPPALWNGVISTSASAEGDRAGYSNSGEVMMDPSNVYNADGTSFAAPHLSALAALYLLNGGLSPCDTHLPVLGYADGDNGPVSATTWGDLPLSTVLDPTGKRVVTGTAAGMCTDFAKLAK